MPEPSHSDAAEEESLKPVEDLVAELTHALKSLEGKPPKTRVNNYQLWSSRSLQRAIDGFAFLRRSRRVDASKLLIRPAIEMAFRLEAVRKHPDLLYRIAFSEHRREKQLVQAADDQDDQDQTNAIIMRRVEEKWKNFSDAFAEECPGISPVKEILTTKCAAEKAEMKYIYDGHYRIYSQYTHGALFASIGYLDEATDREDNKTMAGCAVIALNTLISLGAESPNHDHLVSG